MFKKIYYNKLFPKYNNINYKNLQIDEESISYITIPSESEKISNIIKQHLLKYNKDPNDVLIVDTTAGVGGDTLSFCNNFGNVISIEENYDRYNMLLNNVNQYGFKNITVMNGDSTAIIFKIYNVNVIHIDPPWGGKSYKKKDSVRLFIGKYELEKFIKLCLNDNVLIVTIKIPKNYDQEYLCDVLSEYDIYQYKLEKFNIIVIEKSRLINDNHSD